MIVDNGCEVCQVEDTVFQKHGKKQSLALEGTFVINQNWFPASTFVVKIATFAKPENVRWKRSGLRKD
jgi:hypothetical protein